MIIGLVFGTVYCVCVEIHVKKLFSQLFFIRVNQEEYVFRNENSSFSFNDNSTLLSYDTFTLPLDSRQTCIIVYAVLIISLIVAILIRSVIFVSVCTNASLNLHNRMFNTIIEATMYFFNTNSSGNYTIQIKYAFFNVPKVHV